MLLMSCVCHAFMSVHFCLVVTCWERADLLALAFDVCVYVYVTFPCGILGQVWYLIPDLCCFSYFQHAITFYCSFTILHYLARCDIY